MRSIIALCLVYSGCVQRIIEPQANPPRIRDEVQAIFDISRKYWISEKPIYVSSKPFLGTAVEYFHANGRMNHFEGTSPIILSETPEPFLYQFLHVSWSLPITTRPFLHLMIAFALRPGDALAATKDFNELRKVSRQWQPGEEYRFNLGFMEMSDDSKGEPDPVGTITNFFSKYMHKDFTIIAMKVVWYAGFYETFSRQLALDEVSGEEVHFYVPY